MRADRIRELVARGETEQAERLIYEWIKTGVVKGLKPFQELVRELKYLPETDWTDLE